MIKLNLIAGIFFICLQSLNAQTTKFKVSGHLKGMNNGKIKVSYTGPGAKDFFRDSVELRNSSFTYQGEMKEPHLVYLDFGIPYEQLKNMRGGGFSVFLDGTNIKVKADKQNFSDAIISGSPATKSYQEIIKKTNLFNRLKQIGNLNYRAWVENNQEKIKFTNQQRDQVLDSIADYLFSTKNAMNSYVVAYFIHANLKPMAPEKLETVLNRFSLKLQNSLYIKELAKDIVKQKRLKIGNQTPLFSLSDTSGNKLSLSDFKGKYLLIDFGASWCSWCKKEKPYLLEAYNKFKGSRFELINIAMDNNRAHWIDDLKREAYPWISISDLEGFEGKLAADYNLKGVPEIILVDPDGKILAKGLRGDNIVKTIAEYL